MNYRKFALSLCNVHHVKKHQIPQILLQQKRNLMDDNFVRYHGPQSYVQTEPVYYYRDMIETQQQCMCMKPLGFHTLTEEKDFPSPQHDPWMDLYGHTKLYFPDPVKNGWTYQTTLREHWKRMDDPKYRYNIANVIGKPGDHINMIPRRPDIVPMEGENVIDPERQLKMRLPEIELKQGLDGVDRDALWWWLGNMQHVSRDAYITNILHELWHLLKNKTGTIITSHHRDYLLGYREVVGDVSMFCDVTMPRPECHGGRLKDECYFYVALPEYRTLMHFEIGTSREVHHLNEVVGTMRSSHLMMNQWAILKHGDLFGGDWRYMRVACTPEKDIAIAAGCQHCAKFIIDEPTLELGLEHWWEMTVLPELQAAVVQDTEGKRQAGYRTYGHFLKRLYIMNTMVIDDAVRLTPQNQADKSLVASRDTFKVSGWPRQRPEKQVKYEWGWGLQAEIVHRPKYKPKFLKVDPFAAGVPRPVATGEEYSEAVPIIQKAEEAASRNVIFLNQEQMNIIGTDTKRLVIAGDAGTGKTMLLKTKAKQMVDRQRDEYKRLYDMLPHLENEIRTPCVYYLSCSAIHNVGQVQSEAYEYPTIQDIALKMQHPEDPTDPMYLRAGATHDICQSMWRKDNYAIDDEAQEPDNKYMHTGDVLDLQESDISMKGDPADAIRWFIQQHVSDKYPCHFFIDDFPLTSDNNLPAGDSTDMQGKMEQLIWKIFDAAEGAECKDAYVWLGLKSVDVTENTDRNGLFNKLQTLGVGVARLYWNMRSSAKICNVANKAAGLKEDIVQLGKSTEGILPSYLATDQNDFLKPSTAVSLSAVSKEDDIGEVSTANRIPSAKAATLRVSPGSPPVLICLSSRLSGKQEGTLQQAIKQFNTKLYDDYIIILGTSLTTLFEMLLNIDLREDNEPFVDLCIYSSLSSAYDADTVSSAPQDIYNPISLEEFLTDPRGILLTDIESYTGMEATNVLVWNENGSSERERESFLRAVKQLVVVTQLEHRQKYVDMGFAETQTKLKVDTSHFKKRRVFLI